MYPIFRGFHTCEALTLLICNQQATTPGASVAICTGAHVQSGEKLCHLLRMFPAEGKQGDAVLFQFSGYNQASFSGPLWYHAF